MFLKYFSLILCLSWGALGSRSSMDTCHDQVYDKCGQSKSLSPGDLTYAGRSCNALLGAFTPGREKDQDKTNELISSHLSNSMRYLLKANYFNEWNVDRPGFHAFFNKLADEEWSSGIELMTHMLKRGGRLNNGFTVKVPTESFVVEQDEMETLAWALDTEKEIAKKASHLAFDFNHAPDSPNANVPTVPRDPEFAHYLIERLSDKAVIRIKHLANYVNILGEIIGSNVDLAYGIFTFDREILK